MTPAQFAAKMARVERALTPRLVAAERETVRQALKAAVALSSGTLTEKDLAAQGHPYARRRPTSPNPEVINVRTGLLRLSWRPEGPTAGPSGIVSRVYNTSPEAGFMTGTKLMIPRPIVAAVKKKVLPGRVKRLAKAVLAAARA
jgi:hypothetical protein